MAKVTVALKPKYTTRKAVDKVIFNEGNFLTQVENITARYILSMFDTCYVSLVVDGKYYPIDVDTFEEQFALAAAGEAPTVEADEHFGIKKIEQFVSDPDEDAVVEAVQMDEAFTHGIFAGTLLKVTNCKEAPKPDTIDKNGYWMIFKFDMAGASAEGYSELKFLDTGDEIVDGNNFVFMGVDESEVNKKFLTIVGKLTIDGESGDVEQTFDNMMKAKVLNPADDINAIDVDGVGYENLYDAFVALNGKGGTIHINKSCELPSDKKINLIDGKEYNLIINNGATVSLGRYILIKENTTLNVVGNGTLKEASPYFAPIVMINTDPEKHVDLFVGSGITLIGWTGIFIDKASYNINVTCAGTCVGQNDGSADGAGVYVNGVVKSGTLNFTGSTEGTVGIGMYIAGNFDVMLSGATVVGSNVGMEQRAGNLRIYKSRIVGNTEEEAAMKANGSGSTSENCGLAIAQHTTKHPINVLVDDSTIIGNAAFFEGNPQGNPTATEDTKISINSGAFIGDIKTLADTDCTGFLFGGHFDREPDAKYIAKGYEAVPDTKNTFNVVEKV